MWRERERERGHSEVQIFEIIDSGKILHLIHVFVDTATARAQLPTSLDVCSYLRMSKLDQ